MGLKMSKLCFLTENLSNLTVHNCLNNNISKIYMPKPIQNYLYFRILAKGKVILLQIAIFSFFLDTL